MAGIQPLGQHFVPVGMSVDNHDLAVVLAVLHLVAADEHHDSARTGGEQVRAKVDNRATLAVDCNGAGTGQQIAGRLAINPNTRGSDRGVGIKPDGRNDAQTPMIAIIVGHRLADCFEVVGSQRGVHEKNSTRPTAPGQENISATYRERRPGASREITARRLIRRRRDRGIDRDKKSSLVKRGRQSSHEWEIKIRLGDGKSSAYRVSVERVKKNA